MKVIRELNDQGITITFYGRGSRSRSRASHGESWKAPRWRCAGRCADTNLIESAGTRRFQLLSYWGNELVRNGINLSHEVINKDSLIGRFILIIVRHLTHIYSRTPRETVALNDNFVWNCQWRMHRHNWTYWLWKVDAPSAWTDYEASFGEIIISDMNIGTVQSRRLI